MQRGSNASVFMKRGTKGGAQYKRISDQGCESLHFPPSVWSVVIHNIEEGVIALDADLRALDANTSALKLLGLKSVKGLKDKVDRLIEAEVRELILSGVEVLNAPLTWAVSGEDDVSLLRSFIPVIDEGGEGGQGVILLLKPGLVSSIPPVESWLEWGRGYLTQVTSNLHEAICYLDREGRIVYANQTFEDIAGRPFQDIAGRPLASVLKPVSRPLFLMEVVEKTAKKGSWQGEFEIKTPSGKRSLLATTAQIRSEEGGDLGIAVLARDITERKRLEEEMKWRNRELSIVYDLLQLTTGYHDMEVTLKESLARILSIMHAEAGAIYLRDWETDDLHLVAYQGLTYRSAKDLASSKGGAELAARIMAGSKGVIIDEKARGRRRPVFSGKRGPLLSVAAVPISSRERKAGVLMVGHIKQGHFDKDDLSVLLSLASQVSVVFELTGLLEDLRGKLDELGHERDFSRAVVDTMPSALALLDTRGRFDFVNRRFTEILGYEPDEVESQSFTMLVPEGVRKMTMRDIMTTNRSGSVWMDLRLLDRVGDEIPVYVTSTPRPFEGGEFRGVILTITDLSRQQATEREVVKVEEEAEELSKELAGARDSLQRLDARKHAYLSMVHHEVSAPLKLMKKGLRELDRGIVDMPSEEARTRLEWLRREVDRLEKLSSDIQDVSSAEKGKLRLRRREVDMRELTSRTVDEMALTGRNPISIALPNTPVIGLADAARLEQVLVCMLDNAMQFSPVGSEVKVRLSRKKEIAHWEIEDKGTGMESEQLQGILEFLTGEGRPETEPKTGLGLFLCHHIIQAHKGDMRLDSKPGRGTIVSFSMPLERKR